MYMKRGIANEGKKRRKVRRERKREKRRSEEGCRKERRGSVDVMRCGVVQMFEGAKGWSRMLIG
jgi:hypothetical protein